MPAISDKANRRWASIASQAGQGTEPRGMRALCRSLWPAILAVAIASGLINLLMLTGPLFMLQVYDRVLPSRSGATLSGLALFALAAFLFQGFFEVIRGRMLMRIGRILFQRLGPACLDLVVDATKRNGTQSLRDMDTLRSFVSSGLAAFFDLPWTPLYIAICFAFHPLLGFAVLGGGAMLGLLTWYGDVASRRPIEEAVATSATRNRLTEEYRRNGLAVDALGMRGSLKQRWTESAASHLDRQDEALTISIHLGSVTRIARIVLQSGVLALGAWLVITQRASAGVMLAATILTIRALAPLEQAMANWRGFVGARQAWSRLDAELRATPAALQPTPIALPRRELSVAGVTVAVPGSQRTVVADATFRLKAGSALGILGPSGSGKSSFARALVGGWPVARGVIRLDGATYDQWDRDTLGTAIGYLPQDVELLTGTVAENVARFDPKAEPDTLHKAAADADVQDLIRRLPEGYDTAVGESGVALSGGQRQRLGLARALYRDPFLVVLDEPNSNLDAAGEKALLRAIAGIRERGGIAVIIAHRASVLAAVDQLMVLNEGRIQAIGPRDEVLRAIAGMSGQPTTPDERPAAAVQDKPQPKRNGRKSRRAESDGHAEAHS